MYNNTRNEIFFILTFHILFKVRVYIILYFRTYLSSCPIYKKSNFFILTFQFLVRFKFYILHTLPIVCPIYNETKSDDETFLEHTFIHFFYIHIYDPSARKLNRTPMTILLARVIYLAQPHHPPHHLPCILTFTSIFI